jgi:peptidoglycan hydrolase-like protein with peptidoglycan-binding domain
VPGSGVAVIPANALPPGGIVPINTYGPVGHVDDAFDALVAQAILNGDTAALEALAKQAEARGLFDIARSIRDEIARLKGSAPAPTPPGPNVVPAPSSTVPAPTGRAILSLKAKSRGSDVIEWQRILGIKQDGIFGVDTDAKTKLWQKAHGLVADGIVGPKTWATAYTMQPTLATAPKPSVTPAARPLLSLALKSRGPDVVEWQKVIGVTADGIFGPATDAATRVFQRQKLLKVDGIVGPNSWKAAYAQQPALAAPPGSTNLGIPASRSDGFLTPGLPAPSAPAAGPPESDARNAAAEITSYLTSLGGLSGRYKEDKNRVKSWQSRMSVTADGSYGRDSARAIIQLGLVPVAPYYWPKSGAAAAKAEFLALVKQYSNADAPRAAQWAKLVADTNRS